MGSDWTTIGEIAEVYDGPHATPQKIDNGPYFLSISSLTNGNLDLSQSAHLSEGDFQKWTRRVTPQHGDVLFSYETRLGEAAIMPENIRACLGRRMGLLRPDRTKVDPRFLLFAYLGPAFQQEIRTRTNYGATVERIALKELPDFPIRLPSLAEQKAIAHILGSLDDKIELNRQMNETLEAMAQALFKSWFVDFDPVIDNALAAGNKIPDPLKARAEARLALGDDRKPLPESIQQQFPDSFEYNDEMGWIPAGWDVRPLDELLDIIGGGTPKTTVAEYWGGQIPWFSVVDAPNPSDVFVVDTEKHVTELGVKNSSTKILPKGTTIISARGTVGKCGLVGRPMAMNQSCYGLRGKNNLANSYVYYTVLLRVADLQQRSHGSVFSTITRDTFKTIKAPFGGNKIASVFDQLVEAYLDRILKNDILKNTLSSLRDTLLPKLISGELRIPDAEKIIQKAIE